MVPGLRLKRPVPNRLEMIAKAMTSREVKDAVALHVRKGMIERTTKDNIDESGAPFKDYSTDRIYMSKRHRPAPSKGGRTVSIRGKRKRKLKTVAYDYGYAQFKSAVLGHTAPTLYGMYDMFRALVFRLTPKGVVFYFATAMQNAKAYAHIAGDGVPERNFLGWGKVAGETKSTLDLIRRRVNAIAGIRL